MCAIMHADGLVMVILHVQSPYGEPVEPEKAPEAVARAVASLPPEQMFELMKQMKVCYTIWYCVSAYV